MLERLRIWWRWRTPVDQSWIERIICLLPRKAPSPDMVRLREALELIASGSGPNGRMLVSGDMMEIAERALSSAD